MEIVHAFLDPPGNSAHQPCGLLSITVNAKRALEVAQSGVPLFHLKQQLAPAEAEPRSPQRRLHRFFCSTHQESPLLTKHPLRPESIRNEQRRPPLTRRNLVRELVTHGIRGQDGLERGTPLQSADEVRVPSTSRRIGGYGVRTGR